MNCIRTQSLSKSYGSVLAVNQIDLSVECGKVFGFLGPNGAGKSTTLKMLTTLIPPTDGRLEILGMDALTNSLKIRQRIGVVLQQPSYEPSLSVEKALEKYGMMWDVPKNIRNDRVQQLIEEFGLNEIKQKKNEDLSIGQRRRVQVAREFVHEMDLLFLDEPTVGLDPNARRKLLDYLKMKVKNGLTIFYTTHVLSEAEYLCDEIAIINRGKILSIDSPENIKSKYGDTKTIKIHINEQQNIVQNILSDIPNCIITHNGRTIITIQSANAESILVSVLKILTQHSINIDDLSATPTTLEDIFLKMVNNENASSD